MSMIYILQADGSQVDKRLSLAGRITEVAILVKRVAQRTGGGLKVAAFLPYRAEQVKHVGDAKPVRHLSKVDLPEPD